MKKNLNQVATGLGATGVTISAALSSPAGSLCTGVCGSCGFGCATSFLGVAAAGYVFLAGRKKKAGQEAAHASITDASKKNENSQACET